MSMSPAAAERHAAMLAESRNARRVNRTESRSESPAYISDAETYRPEEIKKRLGLGRDWIRDARRNGLPAIEAGNKILIDGRDLRQYLARNHKHEANHEAHQDEQEPVSG